MPRGRKKAVDTTAEVSVNTTVCEQITPAETSEEAGSLNLRPCQFNPKQYLSRYKFENDPREMEYLETRYRVQWFLQWLKEHNMTGRFEESEYKLYPEFGLCAATCRVFIDDKEVASATASRLKDESGTFLQTAFTIAKGRALANLGFGTVNTYGRVEDGEPFPPDTGNFIDRDVEVTNNEEETTETVDSEAKPMTNSNADSDSAAENTVETSNQTPPQAEDNPPKRRGRKPKAVVEETNSAAESGAEKKSDSEVKSSSETIPTTLEEARRTIINFGKNAGRTVAEVYINNPAAISFYASPDFDGKIYHPDVVRACQIVLENG